MYIRKIDFDKDYDKVQAFNHPKHGERKYPIGYTSNAHMQAQFDVVKKTFPEAIEPCVFGAFEDNKLVGYIDCMSAGYASKGEFYGELDSRDIVFAIEVDALYRNQGVGSQLLNTATTYHYNSSFLGYVEFDNKSKSLKSFYEKNGFNVKMFDNAGCVLKDSEAAIQARKEHRMIPYEGDRDFDFSAYETDGRVY